MLRRSYVRSPIVAPKSGLDSPYSKRSPFALGLLAPGLGSVAPFVTPRTRTDLLASRRSLGRCFTSFTRILYAPATRAELKERTNYSSTVLSTPFGVKKCLFILSRLNTAHSQKSHWKDRLIDNSDYKVQLFQYHLWSSCKPPITYYWTLPLILDYSYLVGKLTSSKIADTKVSGF
jgi:hypothetical protein